jgi:hypothetical protein
VEVDENDEEITAVHPGELEPAPRRAIAGAVRVLPPSTPRPQGVRPGPVPREETVLLATDDAPAAEAARRAGLDADGGWGTVVLPGGGHPGHVVDRTQLLAVDLPDEPSAAISGTARLSLSLGAPEPMELVETASLPGTGRRSRDEAAPVAPPAAPPASTAPGPEPWPVPRAPVPPTGGYPVASGPYPLIGPTPTGGVPVVPRPDARGRGRAPAPTGAHPASDETARLAWGFLLGVLITVAIVGVAVALALALIR